jgi:hypothetical protein
VRCGNKNKDIVVKLTAAKNLKKPNSINESSANYFEISYDHSQKILCLLFDCYHLLHPAIDLS